MNIDDLLSPYRGFKPALDDIVEEPEGGTVVVIRRTDILRATRLDRGPALPSPESWEMYDFVQALTG